MCTAGPLPRAILPPRRGPCRPPARGAPTRGGMTPSEHSQADTDAPVPALVDEVWRLRARGRRGASRGRPRRAGRRSAALARPGARRPSPAGARRGPQARGAGRRARRGRPPVGAQPDLPRGHGRALDGSAPAGLRSSPHGRRDDGAHPRAGQDHVRDLRLRRSTSPGDCVGVVTMRDLLLADDSGAPRDGDAARPVRARPGAAARRGGAPGGGAPLPGLPRVRRRGPARGHRARPHALPGAGARDQRAGRRDGRGREGGAPGDALAAQPALPPSVAAAQPVHGFPRSGGRRPLPGHDQPAGGAGGVPAGARGPVGQHRLPGARRDAARPHARRAASRRLAAAGHEGGAARAPERRARGRDRGNRHVRGRPRTGRAARARRSASWCSPR